MRHHELLLSNVISRLKKSAVDNRLEIEFSTRPDEIGFSINCGEHCQKECVEPDCFAFLRDESSNSRTFFYIEVDRSTETQGHLVHLGRQYQEFRKSGRFAERWGAPYEPKQRPFRVLLIVKSDTRLRNTCERLRHFAQIGRLFWISTHKDFLRDPFGAIWHCPIDFDDLSLMNIAEVVELLHFLQELQ